MVEVKGKYNTAICFTPELSDNAAEQIRAVCDQEFFKDSKIRIMPDVHVGMGCTIGTTMTITDKVVPGMVGVDIGCGMETVRILATSVNFEKLDNLIRSSIPSGRDVHKKPHPYSDRIDMANLRCADHVNLDRARKSIGTLGGGNHFIEVGRGTKSGDIYLVVHSGSRHLGLQVANYYQNQGRKALWGGADYQLEETVRQLKAEGREKEIESTLKKLKAERKLSIPRDLAYVEGKLFHDYIHDMHLTQQFAALNRQAMIEIILSGMQWKAEESFTTIHNYIETETMILRKGAVSAKAGQKFLIPINMRDGSLICVGKGNPDWNYSAPHGAGRLMSRREAMTALSMDDFRKSMSGIFTTSVNIQTLDEAPMAYKSMQEIVEGIGPTADIVERIAPLYNFKAAE